MRRGLWNCAVTIAMIGCGFIFLFNNPAGAQRDSATRQREAQRRYDTAANRWMLEPVDIAAQQDPVPPSIRKARDAYFYPFASTLDPTGRTITGTSSGPDAGETPEISYPKDGVWIVGRFESRRVFQVGTTPGVYTEASFRVQEVLYQPATLSLSPGASVDILLLGGAIREPGGRTLLLSPQPEVRFLQPGHSYLLQLLYRQRGDFYLDAKDWDVTDGTLKPNAPAEIFRASQGRSQLSGKTLPEALDVLRADIERAKAQGLLK